MALIVLPRVHTCGNGSLHRLPDCLTLLSYRSFGLGAYCLIHMKYGCETHLAPLSAPSFILETNSSIQQVKRATAEVSIETRHRSEPRRASHSVAGCKQGAAQSDEARESKTVGFGAPLGTFPARGKYPARGCGNPQKQRLGLRRSAPKGSGAHSPAQNRAWAAPARKNRCNITVMLQTPQLH